MHCHVACVRVKYFSNVTAELRDVAIFCNCCLAKCVWRKICRYVYEKSTRRITRGSFQRYVSLPHSNRRRKIFSHCSHVVILIFLEELCISRSVHINYCIVSPTSHTLLHSLSHITYIIALSLPHHIHYCIVSPTSHTLLHCLSHITYIITLSLPHHIPARNASCH